MFKSFLESILSKVFFFLLARNCRLNQVKNCFPIFTEKGKSIESILVKVSLEDKEKTIRLLELFFYLPNFFAKAWVEIKELSLFSEKDGKPQMTQKEVLKLMEEDKKVPIHLVDLLYFVRIYKGKLIEGKNYWALGSQLEIEKRIKAPYIRVVDGKNYLFFGQISHYVFEKGVEKEVDTLFFNEQNFWLATKK